MNNSLSETIPEDILNQEQIARIRSMDEQFMDYTMKSIINNATQVLMADVCKDLHPSFHSVTEAALTKVIEHWPNCITGSNSGSFFLLLKNNKMSGTMFYHMYHTLCGEHLVRTIAVLLALDAGLIKTEHRVKMLYGASIDVQLDWDKLAQKLAKRRPDFQWEDRYATEPAPQ